MNINISKGKTKFLLKVRGTDVQPKLDPNMYDGWLLPEIFNEKILNFFPL